MAGSIDKVKYVFFSVISLIDRTYGLGFDGDSSLPFKLHIVKDLLLHLSCGKQTRFLNDTVGKRGLAVIDMGNYAKISYKTLIHKTSIMGHVFTAAFRMVFFKKTLGRLRGFCD